MKMVLSLSQNLELLGIGIYIYSIYIYIYRGPEGIYKFVYEYKSNIRSLPTSIYFQSEIFEMRVLNSPQETIKNGELFDPQPQVMLLNASGQPVKGIYIYIY